MKIIRRSIQPGWGPLEYSYINDKEYEGTLQLFVDNCKDIIPTTNWGLVPKIIGLNGSVQAKLALINHIVQHAKSPILAEVSPQEAPFLLNYGFEAIYGSFYLWWKE